MLKESYESEDHHNTWQFQNIFHQTFSKFEEGGGEIQNKTKQNTSWISRSLELGVLGLLKLHSSIILI